MVPPSSSGNLEFRGLGFKGLYRDNGKGNGSDC